MLKHMLAFLAAIRMPADTPDAWKHGWRVAQAYKGCLSELSRPQADRSAETKAHSPIVSGTPPVRERD